MLRGLKYSVRIMGIGWTLARYDALFGLHALNLSWTTRAALWLITKRHRNLRPGQRLSLALQALGPSFIKLGQALSTRADLLGDTVAADLAELQDRLPPFAARAAIATLEEELGGRVADFFSTFDEHAVAAASIAQVHFATTQGGQEVAVKILRPGIEQAFQRDIELFLWLAQQAEKRLPKLRRLKPLAMIETFARTVELETDLRFEAAAADELRENSKDDTDFYVPKIYWDLTARRVLTLERIRGFSAGDVEGMKAAGITPDATMQKAARAFFTQVFRDGFFHADMHPGNLFVLPDGRLAPVDFGIMGRIDRVSQMTLAQILWAFQQGDYMRVAELHREVGWIPPHVSLPAFAQACRAVGAPIFGKPLNEISVGKLVGQLLNIAQMFEMEAQPHLFLLQKTMMTAEGVGRLLNPSVNMWQVSEPLIKAWAEEHFSARARAKHFVREMREVISDAPRMLIALKSLVEQELEKAQTAKPH